MAPADWNSVGPRSAGIAPAPNYLLRSAPFLDDCDFLIWECDLREYVQPEEIVTALRPLINRLTLRHASVPTCPLFSGRRVQFGATQNQATHRQTSGSAFADHILRKIGDHLRRSCTGAAVHRNLLHAHAAHRFDPLH